MKILLFIFLITRPEQYFFQNQTYINEQPSPQPEKTFVLSKKVFIIIIVCVSIVVIVTDQIKDFTNRMGITQRGSVVHHFHPNVLSHHKASTANDDEKHKQTIHSFNQQSQPATNLSLYH